MSFKVGDLVRLIRGWTPMVIIQIKDGQILAKYANNSYHPVTQEDFRNPCYCGTTSTYRRPLKGFVHWDGTPFPENKRVYPMARRYRTLIGTPQVGTYLNTTSSGTFVLEMDSGAIGTYNPQQLEEDIPETFRVKATANNYSCHYEAPFGSSIQVGDVLVSDSSNVYVVLEVGTKSRNPKGTFKGRRIQTSAL